MKKTALDRHCRWMFWFGIGLAAYGLSTILLLRLLVPYIQFIVLTPIVPAMVFIAWDHRKMIQLMDEQEVAHKVAQELNDT